MDTDKTPYWKGDTILRMIIIPNTYHTIYDNTHVLTPFIPSLDGNHFFGQFQHVHFVLLLTKDVRIHLDGSGSSPCDLANQNIPPQSSNPGGLLNA